jgi:hypothetical protein
MDSKPKVVRKKGVMQGARNGSAIMGALLLAALLAAAYFWNDARNARGDSPEAIAERNQEESGRVISSLDTILLTESEGAPTVARVEDPAVLKEANGEFYKNVQTGDYLILYPQRAILYREAENRVINVAPIINTDDLRANTEGTQPAEGSTNEEASSEESDNDN